jgi:hypothetical protein
MICLSNPQNTTIIVLVTAGLIISCIKGDLLAFVGWMMAGIVFIDTKRVENENSSGH